VPYVVNPSLSVTTSPTNISADVKTYPVSGTITLDGVKPMDASACAGSKAKVTFRDVASGTAIDFAVPCSAPDYAFSGTLAPGTYTVTVAGSSPTTNLNPLAFVARPALVVSGPMTGVVLAARSAVPLSGKTTLNGALPPPPDSNTCSTYKAVITWIETTTRQNTQFGIPCGAPDYAFSGALLPGTYKVVISGTGASLPQGTSLPPVDYIFSAGLTVSGAIDEPRPRRPNHRGQRNGDAQRGAPDGWSGLRNISYERQDHGRVPRSTHCPEAASLERPGDAVRYRVSVIKLHLFRNPLRGHPGH
jgi:hypothetical protein